MGPKLYRVPIFYGSDFRHSKLARASNYLAVGSIEFFVARINSWGFEPHQKIHVWTGPQLFTVTIFFGSHVLRMKAEHYTSSLQPSWLLPTPLWMSIVWRVWRFSAASSKAAPDTILPIVIQWRCWLQSPRSLAFMLCKFAALYTSTRCHQTQHATAFYIWTSPLCSSCACICMSISLCRYRVLIFFLHFLSSCTTKASRTGWTRYCLRT